MLVIDIGNAFIKAIYENQRITFPSTIGTSIDNINYDDKEFTVGKNENYLINYSKADRSTTEEFIVGTALKFMKDIDIISVDKLVVGLPVAQWMKDKDDLAEKLEKRSPMTFEYKGLTKVFRYNSVEVQPECIGVFYGSQDIDNLNQSLIIDIGGLTTDIICMDTDGTITKPKTIGIGSLKVLNSIRSDIELKYPEFGNLGLKTVTKFVKDGAIKYKGEYKDISFAYKNTTKLLDELYSILSLEYSEELIKSDLYVLDCLGFFANSYKKKLPHLVHIDDSFANAEGFKYLSE